MEYTGLPLGWEEGRTASGKPYSVNRNQKFKSWDDPRQANDLPGGWEMRYTKPTGPSSEKQLMTGKTESQGEGNSAAGSKSSTTQVRGGEVDDEQKRAHDEQLRTQVEQERAHDEAVAKKVATAIEKENARKRMELYQWQQEVGMPMQYMAEMVKSHYKQLEREREWEEQEWWRRQY